MPVTEKVARLWGKLTGWEIVKGNSSWLYEGHREGRTPPRDYVPDPSEQPWVWVKALRHVEIHHIEGRGWDVAVAYVDPDRGGDAANFTCRDAPEAALAAAIEKMAEAVR